MNRRTLLSVAALACATIVFVPGAAHAQGSPAGQTAPAGDTAMPAATPAQSNPAATATAASPTTTTTTTPAKKVWTNEDMSEIHKNSVISTFSGTSSKPGNAHPNGKAKGGKDAKQYQDQITKLQAKLPPLDEQISELQATLNGATVNSTRHYSGTKIDDWHEELVQLQKQRDDITAKISSLQDEARRNGVPPNQIPE
jgi:uncharacterized protein YukE